MNNPLPHIRARYPVSEIGFTLMLRDLEVPRLKHLPYFLQTTRWKCCSISALPSPIPLEAAVAAGAILDELFFFHGEAKDEEPEASVPTHPFFFFFFSKAEIPFQCTQYRRKHISKSIYNEIITTRLVTARHKTWNVPSEGETDEFVKRAITQAIYELLVIYNALLEEWGEPREMNGLSWLFSKMTNVFFIPFALSQFPASSLCL